MDNLREELQPNRAKYQHNTKANTPFERWWEMLIECYRDGFLDCPGLGAKQTWWKPSQERIEEFANDDTVKNKYARECYDAGENPGQALDSMD